MADRWPAKATWTGGIRHGRSRRMNFVIYRHRFDSSTKVSIHSFILPPFDSYPALLLPPTLSSTFLLFFARFFACLLIFCANRTSRSSAGSSFLLFCSSTFRQMRIWWGKHRIPSFFLPCSFFFQSFASPFGAAFVNARPNGDLCTSIAN